MSHRSENPFSMWAEACALIERAERLHRAFFQPIGAASPAWEPPMDLFEAQDGFLIVVALPGVHPAQIQLLFDGTDLIVAGERRLPAESAGLALRRLEIPAGRFERRIPLPPGRFDVAEQRLADGCLTVILRRL
ncbi:Molecular chaperone IbpA, HSP20 family [Fontimonas thermophila]|uniref:Molecular chaperone IbpA, HSP20 family n=1 Tax=Fontimonas thermophila TaxID=1076937 RepID=A0A1I2KIG4_9GAMM|nr:Hsp20/alpha crystallin family protein [Fontimonas thermophila]SFF64891.1 Molecular chaperone IbpA, HSP20 family [Fontimonas thermophila]